MLSSTLKLSPMEVNYVTVGNDSNSKAVQMVVLENTSFFLGGRMAFSGLSIIYLAEGVYGVLF